MRVGKGIIHDLRLDSLKEYAQIDGLPEAIVESKQSSRVYGVYTLDNRQYVQLRDSKLKVGRYKLLCASCKFV